MVPSKIKTPKILNYMTEVVKGLWIATESHTGTYSHFPDKFESFWIRGKKVSKVEYEQYVYDKYIEKKITDKE